MNIFGVFVIICGITISSNALPVENNYYRDARQTAQQQQLHNNILRSRLKNYPMSELYQTQVIEYPGSASYMGQQQPQSQPQAIYMHVQPQPNWVHTQQQPNYVQMQQQQQPQQQQQQQQYQNYVQSQEQPQYAQSQPTVNTRIDYQQNYQQNYRPVAPEYQQQQVQTVPSVPITTTTTTTTTPEPIIINEQVEEEEAPAHIAVPAVRAPIQPSVRRMRPRPEQSVQLVQQVHNVNRFQPQGQDFADDEILPTQEISRIPHKETEEERLLREEQAKSAHYSFSTSIDDKINDHAIQRQETRDGLALHGMYSYSDGYYKRTIHYQADENGYRVVKEEIEPIGDGPQYNESGTADVTADLHNNHLSYSITADDYVREKEKNKHKTATNAARQDE